jgi:hypothetical protein
MVSLVDDPFSSALATQSILLLFTTCAWFIAYYWSLQLQFRGWLPNRVLCGCVRVFERVVYPNSTGTSQYIAVRD